MHIGTKAQRERNLALCSLEQRAKAQTERNLALCTLEQRHREELSSIHRELFKRTNADGQERWGEGGGGAERQRYRR